MQQKHYGCYFKTGRRGRRRGDLGRWDKPGTWSLHTLMGHSPHQCIRKLVRVADRFSRHSIRFSDNRICSRHCVTHNPMQGKRPLCVRRKSLKAPRLDALLRVTHEHAVCEGLTACLGANFTPLYLVAYLPALVRSAINDRSKSAIPAKTVKIIRPAGVVGSDQGSASERNPAPQSRNNSATANKSEVDLARRSRRVTITTSPSLR